MAPMIPGMLRDNNDKTAITTIIAGKPKDVEGDDKDVTPGLEAAVDDMWAALESKDKGAFREALKSFIAMCSDSEDEYAEPEAELE